MGTGVDYGGAWLLSLMALFSTSGAMGTLNLRWIGHGNGYGDG